MAKILICLLILASSKGINAQEVKSTDSLHLQIARLDSLVFSAFNSRDTATFSTLFSSDLEFYHDKGGLTGYMHTINFAKAQAENKTDLKRMLVPGTLEVYPINNYGAIQIGAHKFCHTENGKQDCGTFKFIHVWKKTGTNWKITRVLSYDH
ncbi:MAG TPA: nuclear transport factor 2 family protein [Chitinophagaceae bacterium]|jgi:hypothetical protein|nr:nuclear transport factor 2 family protein [Chitinophagaceae bacterium]